MQSVSVNAFLLSVDFLGVFKEGYWYNILIKWETPEVLRALKDKEDGTVFKYLKNA